MDWTVRKVGLKDLWRQEWHRNYVPQEHVWPEWMEKAR
jgi:beta-galactosidase/beta-glucuronidase